MVSAADNERKLKRCYVSGCRAFRTTFNSERHFLAFIKGLEIIALNCRKMHEYILAAVVRSDKTKTFVSVKPFY